MLEQTQTDLPGAQTWCCDLDNPRVLTHCDESFLAPDELQLAGRLRSTRHWQLFLRRRALRRFLLGEFLGVSPEAICFEEMDFGKPRLSRFSNSHCEFSTSHSENIFAMAVSTESEIGIDVEVLRPDWNLQSVAVMFLDNHQLQYLENFSPNERQEQFLRFWSLREAFAKASGNGIALPSEQMSTNRAWDFIFNTSLQLPDWNWIQQRHQIGGQIAIISIAQNIHVHL